MFPGFYIFDTIFVGSYGIAAVIGLFTAAPLAIWQYKKRGGSDIDMILTLLVAAAGLFVGMHLLYGITNIPYWGILFKAEDFMDFINRFGAVFSGSVFYGGLLGAMLAGGIYIKKNKLPVGLMTDCVAPFAALFHCFGRIGCFLSGCCYGVEHEHGIVFENAIVEQANGVPRLPVQLYEAAFELALFAVLLVLLHKGTLSGKLFPLYLVAYSVGRFILEFWRGDDYRGFLFGLSTSQLISIGVFIGAALTFILGGAKKAREAEA